MIEEEELDNDFESQEELRELKKAENASTAKKIVPPLQVWKRSDDAPQPTETIETVSQRN
jgi:hypothetical protein